MSTEQDLSFEFEYWVEETRRLISDPTIRPLIYINHSSANTNILPKQPSAMYELSKLNKQDVQTILSKGTGWSLEFYASILPLDSQFHTKRASEVANVIFRQDPFSGLEKQPADLLESAQEDISNGKARELINAYTQSPSPLPSYEVRVAAGMTQLLSNQMNAEWGNRTQLEEAKIKIEGRLGINTDKIVTVNLPTLKEGRLPGMIRKMQLDVLIEHPVGIQAIINAGISQIQWEELDYHEQESVITDYVYSLPEEAQERIASEVEHATKVAADNFTREHFGMTWDEFEAKYMTALKRLRHDALYELKDLLVGWGYAVFMYSGLVSHHDYQDTDEADFQTFPSGGQIIDETVKWIHFKENGQPTGRKAILSFSKIYLPTI